jgi:membrane fusion protein (multidrug efflux system)
VRRSVELGEQVAPSTEMLALVPVTSMWVDANFKENQLGSLRIGQPVRVTVDMYGSHVDYHGKVLGLTAGTGSALAVLPTENATGNWIKIVQRLPARIGLDSGELTRHPLFLGLSADINVDVTDLGGSSLSQMPAWPAVQHTDVYADQDSGADRMIDEIVSANLSGSGKALYARSAEGTPR